MCRNEFGRGHITVLELISLHDTRKSRRDGECVTMLTLLPVAIENEQADGNLPWLQDFASFRINSAERVVGARMDAAAVSAETTERGCSGGNYSDAGGAGSRTNSAGAASAVGRVVLEAGVTAIFAKSSDRKAMAPGGMPTVRL